MEVVIEEEVGYMNDEDIVSLYWERSEQAISETSKKYGKYCYSIAKNILCSNEDAEECVNDTYSDAWQSIPPHKPSVLSIFLGKITRRISIDMLRYRNAGKRGGGEYTLILDELEDCVSGDDDMEQEYERKRLSETINAFVCSLPKTEQKIFLCRYWYMDPLRVISARFGFSEAKVKSMLYRTREKLRDLLIKEGFK